MAASVSTDSIASCLKKGHFEWNNQNNSLEFISNDPSVDIKDKKRKGQDGNMGLLHMMQKRIEGLTPNKSQHGYQIGVSAGFASSRGGARTIGPPRTSPKFGSSKYGANSSVTLKDIKSVALDHMSGENEISQSDVSISFRHLIQAMEFDDFLISLLLYFQCFFEQLEQEQKPQKTSFLEPSKAELQAIAEIKEKLGVVKRRLGQSYCVLILGLGLEKQHHMGCGKKRVSSTHRDKKMFEDLYMFCTYVVWLTFRRKEFNRIKVELGNMLRSKVFNPALQPKHFIPSVDDSATANSKKDISKLNHDRKKEGPKPIAERVHDLLNAKLPTVERLTPAQRRQKMGKRPAIHTAIHQRSTALVALLPLPKEESHYLFEGKHSKGKPEDSLKGRSKKDIFQFTMHSTTQKLGIIGEPTENFNMETLMPKNMENEEDSESNAGGNRQAGESPVDGDRGVVRQTDVISRATTADDDTL